MKNNILIFATLCCYALGVAGGVYYVASHYPHPTAAYTPTPLTSETAASTISPSLPSSSPQITQATTSSSVNPSATPTATTTISTQPTASASTSPSTTASPATTTSPSTSPTASSSSSASTNTAKIVFAADFATNGGCADHGSNDHCDLYTASLDLNSGSVTSVTQATNTSDSEAYPVWNPNGKFAYYSVFYSATNKNVGYVELATKTVGTLIEMAEWPEVSPDGKTFVYDTVKNGTLMQSSLNSDGKSLGSASSITGTANQTDAEYSKDGRYLVFHQKGSDSNAHGAVYDSQTKVTTEYSERTGHCAFNTSGTITVCDTSQGGLLYGRTFANDALGSAYTFLQDLAATSLAKYDTAFSECGGASFNYPNFCGDDNHLLVSASCSTGSNSISFSRLFMITFKNGKVDNYYPIGKYLDDADSGPGKSSWTVDCLK